MKTVIVSVINDLTTDQLVHKVCTSLTKNGYRVVLVGRKQRNSLALTKRSYETKRMFLLFEKGPFFYLEFQIRLFFYLLLNNADVLHANDLDTLMPNFLISKLKAIKLVYDTHELFCEVPELQNNSLKRNTWKAIERMIFPKLKNVFTVNASIAKIYQEEYNVPMHVLRNIPMLSEQQKLEHVPKEQLGLPNNKKIILLQGAGINIHRGAEEAVEAMQYVENAILLIIGSGDVLPQLKQMVTQLNLGSKVMFIDKLPFDKLLQYTHHADLGLTLDKNTNMNYKFSLPNKLFDYIHAGVPVLASNLIEVKKIVLDYQVGTCINTHEPKHIAETINNIFSNEAKLAEWKENTKKVAEILNWEHEEQKLKSVYEHLF